MRSLSDEALIEKTLSGSKSAYAGLMERYERLVYGIAYSYTRGVDDAFDVSQDVFVKAYRKLDTYTGSGSYRAWLVRITHNESISWLRKQKRLRDFESLPSAEHPRLEADQERRVINNERWQKLQEEILLLNPSQQTAVTLRYLEGRPIREIADVLGCSTGNVKSILFRSLARMRERLTGQRREQQ
jgi:RNA polymerase sigma-70 factor (ECF subfamily)